MSNFGIVEYFGVNDSPYPCGYCKGLKQENSDYGMWAHKLSVENYQNLIDRNWRRSGKYCYKPILERTCCPMYTIRCNALEFRLRKSHKKVIKRFNRFVMSGQKPYKRAESLMRETDINSGHPDVEPTTCVIAEQQLQMTPPVSHDRVPSVHCDDSTTNAQLSGSLPEVKPKISKITKAKTIRKERKLTKIMAKEKCDRTTALNIMGEEFANKLVKRNKTKTLEEFLTEIDAKANNKHKFKIRFVSITSDQYKDTFEVSHEVYRKYQIAIHGDTPDKCTSKQYKRFLIDSPLEYWLDDRLIAVGVLDILPHCVSSVYLYYDPEFESLSLGTYSALRELYLVRELQKTLPDLKYYYMGFYIHSCPKMRYKGKYSPSDLLCGEVFTWHPIDKCVEKLDVRKYSRFNDNGNAFDVDGFNIHDSDIMILFSGSVISFRQYKNKRRIDRKEEQEIKEYAKLIGKKCTSRMMLFRS